MAIVKARVRPNNNYGGNAPEGTVVDIEEHELASMGGCLERVADEQLVEQGPATDAANEPKPKPKKPAKSSQ